MKAKPSTSKKPKDPDFDPNAVLAKLMHLRAAPVDEIPAGYHSTEQWSELWDKSNCQTQKILIQAWKNGHMDRQKYRTKPNIRKVDCYRLKANS